MNSIRQVGPQRLAMPLSERMTQIGASKQNVAPASFIEMMQAGVQQVNTAQQNAHASVNELLTGGEVSEVEVFTSVQKADMAFRMLVQVRNKLVQAYEEINSIRI
jgi:flagellar hook-basal body complex protein FliE